MRIADLFCGCGGMSAGFEMAGHEVVFAADNWVIARRVYDANFSHASVRLDLSDIVESAHRISRERPDIVVGGPPCQDFSSAGARRQSDRADLTIAFADIVRACGPHYFVMENVPAAAQSVPFQAAEQRLHKAGYGLTKIVIDASLYGVPQFRKRLFLVGQLGGQDNFLSGELSHGKSERPLTVRQYLGDEFGVEFYYRHPRHWGRRAIYSIDEPAATVRSANRPIPPKYTAHPDDAAPISRVKPLDSKQRSRLQTFPIDFDLTGHFLSDLDLMIANAVPVNLAAHIGHAIGRYEEARQMTSLDTDFRRWLVQTQRYTDRSAGNVVSRLKRVYKLTGRRRGASNTNDEVHALVKSRRYAKLSTSVRSQLKRALLLHQQYEARS
jgi:DNA (cytosine-5)-methyltransferase 1